MTVGEPAEL